MTSSVQAAARDELTLLGGWALRCHGREESVPSANQRVLAFIALYQPCDRTLVAGALWPTVDEHRAHGNLRSALWRLRGSLPEMVKISGQNLGLDGHVSVDVHQLQSLLGR